MFGSPVIIKLALWGAAAVGTAYLGWAVNGWRLDSQVSNLKASYAAEVAKASELARTKEQAVQTRAAELQKEHNREIKTIRAEYERTINSLRERPDRSVSNLSGPASTCSGVSGAELAKGDAEFLAGYAADAARLQSAVKQCEAQYNEVRSWLTK